MNWRAILIFPRLENIGEIQRIREKYDPLYGMTPPHITLVFPFDSMIRTEEMRLHAETALKSRTPFLLRMQGISGHEGSCLFLNVTRGNDEIIDLHRRLYSGLLASYRNRQYTFFPHLTVGRFSNEASFKAALGSLESCHTIFETLVDEVSVIRIDASGCGTIEKVVPLGESP